MRIFVPKETDRGETRVALVPPSAAKLAKLGAEIEVEAEIGASIHRPDKEYREAGAAISGDRWRSLHRADLVLRLRKPPRDDIKFLKEGCIHVSYLDPFLEQDFVREFARAGVSAISMEMIPRSTIAQKMDALSSQANLAGYAAVILAADRLGRIFPMMMTPAGTIRPARVFVIGVGVAGLQAIATARRLGAQVEAFDTRPVVEEQVRSLGAKFVQIDLGQTGQTDQGYAKELTSEQLEKQKAVMAEHCATAEAVITTAQLFGKRAPQIVTTAIIQKMKPGSVVIDLAIETGGNVEGARLDEEVDINGVKILGLANMPGRMAATASEMYSNNVANFVEHFWDRENKTFRLDPQNEILQSCLITHEGRIFNETIRTLLESAKQEAESGK